jgi:predicted transposase/invertase (TIGR01784 family)
METEKKEHDSAYKYLFSNKRIFHQFLNRFVHEDFARKILLEDIELVDKTFVSDEFIQRESDIIYKVKTQHRDVYIYVLVEFQSTVDKTIPIRMLLYILQLYDQLFRNSQKGKLPAIFPVLLYNGSKDWTIPTNIQDLIEGTIPSRYIPSFEYYPVIENKISDRVLKKIKGTVAAIIYLEKQKDEKLLREAVDTVVELIKEEHPEQLRMFSVWLNRMFQNALNEKELERIKELTEVKSMLTQIAEQIEARGVQQGMQQGMQQKARENALKMKEKGYSVEDIADITGLTVEEIQKL